ncbi:MAG: response regulator [Beijerinckiaceae bacterium]|jgi:FixJ family two-component response regulator|nr:response regulator [Beijerinckiaceae bacterium]
MTVHIVEDDDGVRDALAELCKSVGRRVRLYPDGEAFGAGTDVSPSDVVLVDLGLPGEHGSEVIRRIHALPVPPRVIVISGLPLADIHFAMREFANIAVMRKPLTSDLLTLLM